MIRGHGRICAAVLALLLIVSACSNSSGDDGATGATEPAGPGEEGDRDTFLPVDAPGVTDDEIRFASISTITQNPLGTDIGNAYNDGIEAYFAWRNSEGGIYGRDLVLAETLDDQLGRNAEQAQAVVSSNEAFGAFVATLLFTGAEVLDGAGVPTYGWGIHSEFAGKRNLFGHISPICAGCAGRSLPYLAQQVGASKVGILAYNSTANSRECGSGNRASIETYGEEAGGIEVGYFDDNLSFGLPGGVGPQVSAMADAEVDYVATCMDLNGVKVLAEELHEQGLDDVVIQHPNSYDDAFVAANAEIFEGDLVITTFAPFEAEVDSELGDKFVEWTDEIDADRGELTMIGWLNADLAFTSLLEAGPDFNRTRVVDAARSLTDYNADNLLVPIDWSLQLNDPGEDPDSFGRWQCGAAVRIEDGELVQFTGEPGSPWFCWDRDAVGDDGYPEPEIIGDFSDAGS